VSTNPELGVTDGAYGAPFSVEPFESGEFGPLPFVLGAEAPLGLQDGLAVEVEFDGTTIRRLLGPVTVGTPVAVFIDDATTTDGWDTGSGWGLTGLHTSPPTAFADSPSGSYPNNT